MSLKINYYVRNINLECAIFKFNFSASCLGALYLGSKLPSTAKISLKGAIYVELRYFIALLPLNAMYTSMYISLGFESPL